MDTQNLNAPNNEQTNDAPKVEVITNEQKLNDLKSKYKQAILSLNVAISEDKPQDEQDKLSNDAYNLKSEINKVNALIEVESKRKENEQKLHEHLSTIFKYKDALNAQFKYLASIPNNDERNDEQRAQVKANDEAIKSFEESLITSLTNEHNNVKRVLHVPMGTTGKQVEASQQATTSEPTNGNDTSKNAQIIELMRKGLSNDDILKLGFIDGTIRYARWQYNKQLKQASNNAK